MIVKPIDSILDETSKQLGIDRTVVRVIVYYYCWWVFQRLEDIKYGCIHIPNIGAIYLSKANYLYAITNYIKLIREGKNPSYFREKLNILFKARHKLKEYLETKKKKTNKKWL